MLIDTDIPAGNAVIERIDGDNVFFRPDLRDTEGHWFYWHLRVRGAAGRTLRFHIGSEHTLTARGPAVSTDGGWSWGWKGWTESDGWGFTHAFGQRDDDVRFSMGMPYTQRNWERFAATLAGHSSARFMRLCASRKGRPVELLEIGTPGGHASHNIVITARHHCCEMMANYVMEGIIAAALDDSVGKWFAANCRVFIVPFIDKDGVEDGDQGKNRRPHDHGRDYGTGAIYPEPAALRELIKGQLGGRVSIALDIHCPWIRYQWNEHIYQVGSREPANWLAQQRFAPILQKHAAAESQLPYLASGDLPFGQEWNKGAFNAGQMSFSACCATEVRAELSTAIEVPYATAGGVDVTPARARTFGNAFCAAMQEFLSASA